MNKERDLSAEVYAKEVAGHRDKNGRVYHLESRDDSNQRAFKTGWDSALESKVVVKLVEALKKAEQYMVTTNLARAKSRGDYQVVSEAIEEFEKSKVGK